MTDWPRLRQSVRTIFDHLDDDQTSQLLRRHHAATVVACRGREIIGYYQFYPHDEPGVAWLNHFGVVPHNIERAHHVDRRVEAFDACAVMRVSAVSKP